jgi:hypothetical protein
MSGARSFADKIRRKDPASRQRDQYLAQIATRPLRLAVTRTRVDQTVSCLGCKQSGQADNQSEMVMMIPRDLALEMMMTRREKTGTSWKPRPSEVSYLLRWSEKEANVQRMKGEKSPGEMIPMMARRRRGGNPRPRHKGDRHLGDKGVVH